MMNDPSVADFALIFCTTAEGLPEERRRAISDLGFIIGDSKMSRQKRCSSRCQDA